VSDDLATPSTAEAPSPNGTVDGGPGRRRVAPFIALAAALLIGALFVVLAGSEPARDETVDSSLFGEAAPGATGDLLDQTGTFDLSRRKGSWVVLNFFDPACGPCVNEHPELVAFNEQQAAMTNGAELYTIINRSISRIGGDDQDVAEFFDERGGGWPVVRDPDGSISVDFGVSQVPETWVIDPDGIVRERFIGEITAENLGALLQQYRELRT
jgi:cytochrome c biogenesis protein CcmG/thiol:disulfide interchange protein DsbE